MAQLTEEEKQELRKMLEALKVGHKDYMTYSYDQAALLKKVPKYKDSNGICFAMSLDWLRRLLYNASNPLEKQKRNFNDAKYTEKESKLKALTKKQAELHDVYKPYTGRDLSLIINQMRDSNVVSKGMDQLKQHHRAETISPSEYDEEIFKAAKKSGYSSGSENAHLKVKEFIKRHIGLRQQEVSPQLPGVGVLMELEGEAEGWGGHTIAFYIEPNAIRVFDPNLGEYRFPLGADRGRTQASNFITDLWYDIYFRIYKFTKIALEFLKYGDQG